jgi:hypothetical protein
VGSSFNFPNYSRNRRIFIPYNDRAAASAGLEPDENASYQIDQNVGEDQGDVLTDTPPDAPHPLRDRFLQLASDFPNREKLKPSKWQGLAIALAGGLAQEPKLTENASNHKLNEARQDWRLKTDTAKELADIEERDVSSQRRYYNTQMDEVLKSKRADEYGRHHFALEKAANDRQASIDADRKADNLSQTKRDVERERHERMMEETAARLAGAAETRAAAAETNANRPRMTDKPVYNNPMQVRKQAVENVLTSEPGFRQYLEDDGKGNYRLKQTKTAPQGTLFGTKNTEQPLKPEDRQALKDFLTKVNSRAQELMKMTRNNFSLPIDTNIPGSVETEEEEIDR